MSYPEIAHRLSALILESDQIFERQKKIRSESASLIREVIGEVDRELLGKLSALPVDIKEYDVDGLTWYLFSMTELGEFKKDFVDCRGDRILIPKFDFDSEHGFFYIDTMYLVRLLGQPQHFALGKHPRSYMSDAMMLTDCRGHRIHTCHSYEGYRSVPHWGPHFRKIEDVKGAVQDYVEDQCEKQKHDVY